VNRIEGQRAAFTKASFHAEWPDRSVYHAMINTASAAKTVIHAIMSLLQQTQMRGLIHFPRCRPRKANY
jgi:hypothetical protein